MGRYKCIPLPFYFADEESEDFFFHGRGMIERYTKIEPVFNRHGMYYDRKEKVAWIETKHGSWQLDDASDFFCQMEYISNDEKILHPRVVQAIKDLERLGVKSKELQKLLITHRNASMIRDTYRSAVKWRVKTIGH